MDVRMMVMTMIVDAELYKGGVHIDWCLMNSVMIQTFVTMVMRVIVSLLGVVEVKMHSSCHRWQVVAVNMWEIQGDQQTRQKKHVKPTFVSAMCVQFICSFRGRFF